MLGMGNNLRIGCKTIEIPFSGFLYDNGTENVEWEAGFSTGLGVVTKEADHLNLENYADTSVFNGNAKTYVTKYPISLLKVFAIQFIYEHITDNTIAYTRIGILKYKDERIGPHTQDCVQYQKGNAFTSYTRNLDVTTVSGAYYIAIGTFEAAAEYATQLKVHSVSAILL